MGWRTGRPASLESVEISAAPRTTRQTSVVVPPMSKLKTLSRPSVAATCWAAEIPAAGPESAIDKGRRAAASGEAMPPAECMTCRRAPWTSRCRRSR